MELNIGEHSSRRADHRLAALCRTENECHHAS
uniref:Uncharacterized protein n=1 Tax=Rhizophora mucronata TaxID=61149 RepID=A0A2P2NPC8_RHIMU